MRLFTLLILAFSFSVNAQTASDFTITDVDGNSRNLFTELDANNVVVLKFFTNWCSVCNNTASDVVSIYNGYQSNGDPVVFWALDRDQNETNADAITYRNNNSIPFPVIGEAYPIAQQFGVLYQPEYYIISPDRSYVFKATYGAMNIAVQDALASLTTSISEQVLKNQMLVSNRAITWQTADSENATLRIVELTGRQVLKQAILGGEKVELNLPTGVYLYAIENDYGVVATGKLGLVQ